MIRDILMETFWSLSSNKVRSGLTVLGIVIGIASVIAMVSIGQGAQKSIATNIESIGSNLIIVMPGSQRNGVANAGRGSAQTLTIEDADAIRSEISGIKAVAPDVSRRYQITAKGSNTNTEVVGTVADYLVSRNITMEQGNFFSIQDQKTSAKFAVLGPTARDDLFGIDANPIGRFVRIKNVDFEVIGVATKKGGSGFNNPDDFVYVPITSAQHFLSGDAFVNTMSIAAESQDDMASVQQAITELLLSRHGINDPTQADFTIMNQNDIIATASSITGTFTILLSSIAGISLLVGGIGIMNMMLTTVTERTREIGLRKAVGIRRRFIQWQFLAEAVVLTLFGGIIGVVFGWIISMILSYFSGLSTVISVSAILLAFGVSAGVGIVFGMYPARRAANLSPIDALRYE